MKTLNLGLHSPYKFYSELLSRVQILRNSFSLFVRIFIYRRLSHLQFCCPRFQLRVVNHDLNILGAYGKITEVNILIFFMPPWVAWWNLMSSCFIPCRMWNILLCRVSTLICHLPVSSHLGYQTVLVLQGLCSSNPYHNLRLCHNA